MIGEADRITEWLTGRMRWTLDDLTDGEFDRARLAARANGQELRTAWWRSTRPPPTRYFVRAHAGWDRWSEDYLSRDEVIAFISGDSIAMLWLAFHRVYG